MNIQKDRSAISTDPYTLQELLFISQDILSTFCLAWRVRYASASYTIVNPLRDLLYLSSLGISKEEK